MPGIDKMSPPPDQDNTGSSTGEGRPPTVQDRTIRMVDGCIDSRDLFVEMREIVIGHGEDRYRLRLTAQNKLILTK
jgi:hemin uptake protein HemP